MSLSDPDLWSGAYAWVMGSLSPLIVFLVCVLPPLHSTGSVDSLDWFASTCTGLHRIRAHVHAMWLGAACVLAGIAQVLAWDGDNEAGCYAAAMILFTVITPLQWAWVGAYFRVVDGFRVSRVLIFLLMCLNTALAGLYMRLSVIAGVLLILRVVFHDLPMVFINHTAVARTVATTHDIDLEEVGMVSEDEGREDDDGMRSIPSPARSHEYASDSDMPPTSVQHDLRRLGISIGR